MFVARNVRNSATKISSRFQWRSFCSSTTQKGKRTPDSTDSGNGSEVVKFAGKDVREAYKDVYNLDFKKAAKLLFDAPTDKKKFGLDFHLVQLFFVCLPSLAVYLVAQYARYEMRKMDANLELKKKGEEAKAKEMEAKAAKEKEDAFKLDPELLNVKERLEALEETIKEIVTEKTKVKGDDSSRGSKTLHVPYEQTPNRSDDNQGGQSRKANGKDGEAKDEGSTKM